VTAEVHNPYKHRPPKIRTDITLDPILLKPPDVRKCPIKDHWHYDARWGGCPRCGDRGEAKLQKEDKALRAEAASWKEAWYVQREATGRVAWQIPIPYYMSHVPIDPRVFTYFRDVEYLLKGFFKLLTLVQEAPRVPKTEARSSE
jgi:hypothetical protein